MADRPASEATEQPTPERLRKAREEGRIPTSQEVGSAMMIGMLLLVLGLAGSATLAWLADQTRRGLSLQAPGGRGDLTVLAALDAAGGSAMLRMLPYLLAGVVVSVLASLVAGGWAFSPKAVRLNFKRINPVQGFKSMFSSRSFVRLGVSLTKIVVISVIVYFCFRGRVDEYLALRWGTPEGIIAGIGRLVLGVAGRIALALAGIAILDLLFQRWKHKKDLRMTRQEVKEERKQHELSPEVRGRIRGIQMELTRRRMLQEVPMADVVVTNPTHVAVALKYDAGTMGAPVVVAKGPDLVCQRIKEIAKAHGVPIIERAELARTLYAAVEVGEAIPEALFVAVAEVLAMIYRLRRRRLGGRTTGRGADKR